METEFREGTGYYSYRIVFCHGIASNDPDCVAFREASNVDARSFSEKQSQRSEKKSSGSGDDDDDDAGREEDKEISFNFSPAVEQMRQQLVVRIAHLKQQSPKPRGSGEFLVDSAGNIRWTVQVNDISKVQGPTQLVSLHSYQTAYIYYVFLDSLILIISLRCLL
jgi:hypothetical protein